MLTDVNILVFFTQNPDIFELFLSNIGIFAILPAFDLEQKGETF
jgi:hypothetical protein